MELLPSSRDSDDEGPEKGLHKVWAVSVLEPFVPLAQAMDTTPTKIKITPATPVSTPPSTVSLSSSTNPFPSRFDLYTFPSPHELLIASSESKLRAIGFGYRAR
jgi:hypothetical protein